MSVFQCLRPLAAAAVCSTFPLVAGAAPLVSIDDFAGTCGSALVCAGDAAVVGAALRLTPAVATQSGAAWLAVPVQLTPGVGFVSDFTFRMHGAGDMAADGLAFLLAADPTSLGAPERYGGSMGFEGVANTLAVEFDTFDNGSEGNNHVAIDRDGVLTNDASYIPHAMAQCDFSAGIVVAGCMANGDVWTARVAYDGQAMSVTVRDGADAVEQAIAGYSVDLSAVLGGSLAYVGFTAGSGDGFQNHDILGWSFALTDGAPNQTDTEAVPEPASAALLAMGLMALAARRRRVVGCAETGGADENPA